MSRAQGRHNNRWIALTLLGGLLLATGPARADAGRIHFGTQGGWGVGYGPNPHTLLAGWLVQTELIVDDWLFAGSTRDFFGGVLEGPEGGGLVPFSVTFGSALGPRFELGSGAAPSLAILAGPVLLLEYRARESSFRFEDGTVALGCVGTLRLELPRRLPLRGWAARRHPEHYRTRFIQLSGELYPSRDGLADEQYTGFVSLAFGLTTHWF